MRAPSHMDNHRSDGGSLYISADMEDFSDYLWMEDVESFDKQVLAELEEEEEMLECMEEMLAEEEARDTTYYVVDEQNCTVIACPALALGCPVMLEPLCDARILLLSELNPEAAEFVPGQTPSSTTTITTSSSPGATTTGGGVDASPDR